MWMRLLPLEFGHPALEIQNLSRVVSDYISVCERDDWHVETGR